jgi:hypothetical protein
MINRIYYSKFGFDHALTEKPKEPIYSVRESRNVPTGDRVPCFTTSFPAENAESQKPRLGPCTDVRHVS